MHQMDSMLREITEQSQMAKAYTCVCVCVIHVPLTELTHSIEFPQVTWHLVIIILQ